MVLSYDTLPDIIWGEMYGRKRTDPNAVILEIKKHELQKTKKDDSIIYIWGWPGPDANIYQFSDYGETWAFTKEELAPAVTWDQKWGKKAST